MKVSQTQQSFFTNQLMKWSQTHHRDMPWKGEKDPYKIWLSEVMLQQTRVSQGMPYYLKFIEKYPTIDDLANAPADEVMRLWQGLGYYSRARYLHESAQKVSYEMGGQFPATYEEIIQLKGVGPYSAAAIASFAFDEPTAVVDGNVMRILARYFGIEMPIDSTEGKKYIARLANELIDSNDPGKYNQAIMDFGAGVCLPQNPLCANCPLQKKCVAYQQGKQGTLPQKEKKVSKKHRYLTYLVMHYEDQWYVRKREGDDIWKGLYEFPLIEDKQLLPPEKLTAHPAWDTITEGLSPTIEAVSKTYKHQLTHRTLNAIFIKVKIEQQLNSPFIAATSQKLDNFAFPKLIERYLKEYFLYLNFGL